MLKTLIIFLFSAMAHTALAQSAAWLPSTGNDLQATQLASSRVNLPSLNNDRTAVQFSWPVSSSAMLNAAEQPYVQQSRQYWLDVSSTSLASGITIATTAPGAIVRISPLQADRQSVELSQSDITLSVQGNRFPAGQGIASLANQQSLNAAGANFSAGSVAFRLDDSTGSGEIGIQIAAAAGFSDQFVVHVFEPDSPAVLNLQVNRSNYLTGSQLRANLSLQGIEHQLSAADIQAYLSSPDADISVPVSFTANRQGGFDANARLPDTAGNSNGLWSLHALVKTRDNNGLTVMRDAKTALAVALPTARLNNQVGIHTGSAGGKATPAAGSESIQIQLGIDTAIAGRYAVSGVLYGTNRQGQQQPIAVAESANWLNAGQSQLNLNFAADLLSATNLTAPFSVRHLQLKDQSRLSLLQTRQQGLRITL